MKIQRIDYTTKTDFYDLKLMNDLLAKNIPNDYLFENHYFQIRIKSTNYIQLIYRIMWEQMYLRRKKDDAISYLHSIDEMCVRMSISEAICFIYQALPPVLKKNIEKELTSIERIHKKLHEILIGSIGTNNEGYYLSHFCQIMRLQEFENTWNFDLTKLHKLMKIVPESLVCQIVSSTSSIKNMISEDIRTTSDHTARTQVLVATKNTNDLSRILLLSEKHRFHILSIKFENGCYYIMIYIPIHFIYYRSEGENINSIIKSSYQHIFPNKQS